MPTNNPQTDDSHAALDTLIAQCNNLNQDAAEALTREISERLFAACEIEADFAGTHGWEPPRAWTIVAVALANIIRSILSTMKEHSPEAARVVGAYVRKIIDASGT